MKRILINATQQEELRVAIVIDNELINLDIEISSLHQKKGNIYKGTVAHVEPSLEAAFVDYGGNRHGFLPFKEISESYYKNAEEVRGQISINDVINTGQQVLVQIEREEKGTKGAALTTFISLAGRYLVMMPNNPFGGGVSRRIGGQDRHKLREIFAQLDVNNDESIIVRTAGIGHTAEDLQWDLDNLRNQWTTIVGAAKSKPAPFLVYQENNILIRALRDYFDVSFDEIIIDDKQIYEDAKQYLEKIMPQQKHKLNLYEKPTSLFSEYQIEQQVETAYNREVRLPSGGTIVFDQTEALLSIDINSSKATKGRNIEATALSTNLEACKAIACQLRIRDAGGLIVIDFIDMSSYNAQRAVEKALTEAIELDRARIQMGRISRFGLLEVSRQHLRPSLGDISHIPCPRCKGNGTIRTVESCTLSALRLIEEEAMRPRINHVFAYLPLPVMTFIANEKNSNIANIKAHCQTEITIIPDINLETPHFKITSQAADDTDAKTDRNHNLIPPATAHYAKPDEKRLQTNPEAPMVGLILPRKPAPKKSLYLLSRIFDLFGKKEQSQEEKQLPTLAPRTRSNQRRSRDRSNDSSGGRRNSDRRSSRSGNRSPRQSSRNRSYQDRNGNVSTQQQRSQSNQSKPRNKSQSDTERHSSQLDTGSVAKDREREVKPKYPHRSGYTRPDRSANGDSIRASGNNTYSDNKEGPLWQAPQEQPEHTNTVVQSPAPKPTFSKSDSLVQIETKDDKN